MEDRRNGDEQAARKLTAREEAFERTLEVAACGRQAIKSAASRSWRSRSTNAPSPSFPGDGPTVVMASVSHPGVADWGAP